jgi:quercetin dioxygenase-like cupin family protein
VRSSDQEPTFVPPHAGRVLDFLAVTHKLTSEHTGGAYYIFETAFDPGTGNKLHVHRREDEIGYVLEGALEIRLADRTQVLDAGGLARLPKGIAHAIRNPLETPSRYLFFAVPGGLDQWFDAVAHAKDNGALDDAVFRALSHDHGIDWLE